jgi:hypothetical protein
MYKVRGTDQREYGPVPAEIVCHWVHEGRANGKTLVRAEGTEEWRSLNSVVELARALPMPPPVPPDTVAVVPAHSGLNKVVPYRNIPALAGYYCAVFAIIPLFAIFVGGTNPYAREVVSDLLPFAGVLPGFIAAMLGLSGLRLSRQTPAAGGKVHSWIGIVLGGACALGYLAMALAVYSSLYEASRYRY